VNYSDVFWLVERTSTPWSGSWLEPRLLLRLGVQLCHRQGRDHRGRGLGLL